MLYEVITHADANEQYQRDAEFLFDVLEKQVIPLYYERDANGLPHKWLKRVKQSMQTLGWRFNADRMVRDYAERFYIPAAGAKSASYNFV